jgi:hypothetical protein
MDKDIIVERSDLIQKCDQFLSGVVSEHDLCFYATTLLSEDYDWDDMVISDVVHQWCVPIANFPFTRRNFELWRHYLMSGEDLLLEHNSWRVHIDKQKEICKTQGSKWRPFSNQWKVDLYANLNSDVIHGCRTAFSKGHSGWHLWSEVEKTIEEFPQ